MWEEAGFGLRRLPNGMRDFLRRCEKDNILGFKQIDSNVDATTEDVGAWLSRLARRLYLCKSAGRTLRVLAHGRVTARIFDAARKTGEVHPFHAHVADTAGTKAPIPASTTFGRDIFNVAVYLPGITEPFGHIALVVWLHPSGVENLALYSMLAPLAGAVLRDGVLGSSVAAGCAIDVNLRLPAGANPSMPLYLPGMDPRLPKSYYNIPD